MQNNKNDNSISTAIDIEDDNRREDTKKSSNDNNNNNNDKDNNNINSSVEQGPFAFTPFLLSNLFNPKNTELLKFLGGTDGIIKGLHTDAGTGLSSDEIAHLDPIPLNKIIDEDEELLEKFKVFLIDNNSTATSTMILAGQQPVNGSPFYQRKMAFGINVLPQKKLNSIFKLMLLALKERILILLIIAAILSFSLGLYQDFNPSHPAGQPRIKWVEGVAIIIAIVIVVMVGSINDWQKERQFRQLNAKKEDRYVKATRDGKEILLSVHEILVGDILHLEPGDVTAADGLLVSGHNLKCDESVITGESDAIRKVRFEKHLKHDKKQSSSGSTANISHHRNPKVDPFIISGSKVLEGMGSYVVTNIGANSLHGRAMMSFLSKTEDTPFQIRLRKLADKITIIGGIGVLLLVVVSLIEYFASFRYGTPGSATDILQTLSRIIISAVALTVVAIPEGLPVAVTLSLAYTTTRMLKDNNLVRILVACETMGNATIICSDKTGTLTQNKMSVVVGTFGLSKSFAKDVEAYAATIKNKNPPELLKNPTPLKELEKELPSGFLELLEESIAINTTAFEGEGPENGKVDFIGSKTDTAMLNLLFDLNLKNYKSLRESAKIQHFYPFNSDRKAMGAVVNLGNNKSRFFMKGASEILLGKTIKAIKITDKSSFDSDSDVIDLTEKDHQTLYKTIDHYADQGLRTVVMAYRDFEQSEHAFDDEARDIPFEDLAEDITLIGIVGIEDPLRDGVRDAVLTCQKAGVRVCMVTGDNLLTAISIATQCGIYTDGKVMEGPDFRKLKPEDMKETISKLQILARSSPDDKRILVSNLKERGEVVAVTGDGTNDGPALRTADIGFSMGISGTEVAKEASSIILMDDNFASIVKAIMWGRSVNDSVRKFLQFLLTVDITAVILTFISAVSSDKQESVFTAIQLLWINLVMNTLAALALSTDPPTPELLNRGPEPRISPLITFDMWKMILGQSAFQLVVTMVLLYDGKNLLRNITPEDRLPTVVFNTFIFLQIFNEINCRRLNRKFNILKNITANKMFLIIILITASVQILMVEFGGQAFQTESLSGYEWLLSIVIGFMSIPVGFAIRLIPNKLFCCYNDHEDTLTVTEINRNLTVVDDEKGLFDEIFNVQSYLKIFKYRNGNNSKTQLDDDEEKQATRSNSFAEAATVPSSTSASVAIGGKPGENSGSGNNSKDANV